MDAAQGVGQIGQQQVEGPGGRVTGLADQHVIPAGMAFAGQHKARDLAQPALGAVAGNGIADLLGTGESHPDVLHGGLDFAGITGVRAVGARIIGARFVGRPSAGLEQEGGGGLPAGPGGPQEIGSLGENDQLGRRRRPGPAEVVGAWRRHGHGPRLTR